MQILLQEELPLNIEGLDKLRKMNHSNLQIEIIEYKKSVAK